MSLLLVAKRCFGSIKNKCIPNAWASSNGLRPFITDELPVEEDAWRPKKNQHYSAQFYGLYAGDLPVKTYTITKFRKKSRRHILPGTEQVALYSEIMDRCYSFTVTKKALDQIDLHGGLDRYLLHSSCDEIASYPGIALRKQLKQKLLQEACKKEI